MKWIKKGKIIEPVRKYPWWVSHAMAPSAIALDDSLIRVYLGCWDEKGISRIGYVDLQSDNPCNIIAISENPVLDIGRDGAFDENGVFPAHAAVIQGKIYLYFTGFQLGHKITHYNFGGLAISEDGGNSFKRVSEAPILDRADEGLYVRAGQSVLCEEGFCRTVYSAGSEWQYVGGKLRPTYDVYYQKSSDPLHFSNKGTKILTCNYALEHGLGRPQIIKAENNYLVFYTRRMKDMKYYMGCAKSSDCKEWTRMDDQIGITHSASGWDSKMVYFPSVLQVKGKTYLFYSGNGFGKEGFGFAELEMW